MQIMNGTLENGLENVLERKLIHFLAMRMKSWTTSFYSYKQGILCRIIVNHRFATFAFHKQV